jgi:hypothetical protein
MRTIELQFVGIDDFNRPCFYSKELKKYFGSTNKLFEHGADKATVLSKITDIDICYFGRSFNCEPMGGNHSFEFKFV